MTYALRTSGFHVPVARRNRRSHSALASLRRAVVRLFNAVVESREQEAERNVRAYLARTGGRFTDSIEREINDRQFNGGWNLRR